MKPSLLVLLAAAALPLAGCESSSRLGYAPPPVALDPEPGPALAAPTSRVTSTPLPPVNAASTPAQPLSSNAPPPGAPPSNQVASLPPPAMPASPPPAPTARGLAGNWRISDAGRGNCSIGLTQAPLLDLYRANPSGCQAGSLAKVDAWQQRGQEVVLLEPGGRTAVRLFPKGDGTYEGAATSSGTLIRMSR